MQPVCTRRTTIETTNYILFKLSPKELVLKTTDLEISLQASYKINHSTYIDQISFMVHGKRIYDIVREMDGQITCSVKDGMIFLNTSSVSLSLNIKDPQEFPVFPERIENLMAFQPKELLDMISKVSFLIPQNNVHQALNGLLLEIDQTGLIMTTTDGHCLAQLKSDIYKLTDKKKWLIPRRAIYELKKIIESTEETQLFIGICKNNLVFSGENFNFFTKLMVENFPQYESIVNQIGFKTAKIERNHLTKALRRASCLLSGQFIATKLHIKENKMDVSMENKEVGTLHETLEIMNLDGADFEIRFYAPYLLNGLQVFTTEKINFALHSASKPIIFNLTQENIDFVYLVMPVAPSHV